MGDPIDKWLSTPAPTNVEDGLGWWTPMDQTKDPLARMGLDFLSAPGMINTAMKWDNILTCQCSNINRCRTHILPWWSHCLKNETFII